MDAVASVSCKDVPRVKKGAEGNQGGETYDCCRDIAVERPPGLGRVLAVLVAELLVQV